MRHALRGDLTLRMVIEGKVEGRKTGGRSLSMDWMMTLRTILFILLVLNKK